MNNFQFVLHPGFALLLGGISAAVVRQKLIRQVIMVVAPLWSIAAALSLPAGTQWGYPFMNLQLVILRADALSLLFAFIFGVIAFLSCLYALHVKSSGEAAAALLYAGSSLSVVMAGDWLTLIFFWEIMAISSVFLVWNRKTPQAIAAGFRYLLIHMLGGNLLLAGIFLQVTGGQLTITPLTGMQDGAYWLILVGIAINAAIPPLHAWLTDAYPEATPSGSVFLSSFTTKTAIYCLIRIFPGTQLLLYLGVLMALYGVIFAILENNIRRLLSYHILSQLGFMLVGIGIGTELSLNGAAALACSHLIYNSLLFMGAGAVVYATGKNKLTELGGLYRSMPWTAVFFGIAALSISGIPLFVGFITKPMVITAAIVNRLPTVELLLTVASIGTFLSIALKLNYFMFFGAERGLKTEKIPFNMSLAMAGGSFLCLLYGMVPRLFYERLPYVVDFQSYTVGHVFSTVQLMLAALVAFWLVLPKMATHNVISLDTDWFYRKPFAALMGGLVRLVCEIKDQSGVYGRAALTRVVPFFRNPVKWAAQTVEGPAPDYYDADRYRTPVGVIVLVSIVIFVLAFSYVWLWQGNFFG